jgi:hypothetical protein
MAPKSIRPIVCKIIFSPLRHVSNHMDCPLQ